MGRVTRQCQQCGNPATVVLADDDEDVNTGIPLCIDCHLKYQQAQSLQFQRMAQQLNIAGQLFNAVSGIPNLVPRLPMQPAPQTEIHNMHTQNIRVTNSTIGVLNTGWINEVSSSVNSLRNHGESEIAEALDKIKAAILDAREFQVDGKNEALERLAVIAAEAQKPVEQRKLAVIRSVFNDLSNWFSGTAGLITIWQAWGPTIQRSLGF